MNEERDLEIAEEWLNDIIENLNKESFNDIKKAVYGDVTVTEQFNRNEELIFDFIKDFLKFWGRLPSAIEKNF